MCIFGIICARVLLIVSNSDRPDTLLHYILVASTLHPPATLSSKLISSGIILLLKGRVP
jgi:hypothetical protein